MAAIVPLLWAMLGHSMAFSTTGMVEGHIGWRAFVSEVDLFSAVRVWSGALAENVGGALQMLSQMAPAILAPCILVGAVAERIKLVASIVMSTLWLPCVYVPVLHATHAGPGSFLGDLGVLDAGGTPSTYRIHMPQSLNVDTVVAAKLELPALHALEIATSHALSC
jgi:ammonium transporter, Amt family